MNSAGFFVRVSQMKHQMTEVISMWFQKPEALNAAAITMGFVWGMLMGIVVTLLIVIGV